VEAVRAKAAAELAKAAAARAKVAAMG